MNSNTSYNHEHVARENQFKFIVLFGSAAQGTLKDSSDVDIAVLKADHTKLTYEDHRTVYELLESLYSTGMRMIDLVDLSTANPLLRYEAVMYGKLLQGNELDFAEYKLFAFKDYIDSQSLLVLEKKIITKRQQFLAEIIAQTV